MKNISNFYNLVKEGEITNKEFIRLIKTISLNENLTGKELGIIFESYVFSKGWIDEENKISPIITISELIEVNKSFKTKNGCSWARSDNSYLGKKYNIERTLKNGKVHSIQLKGENESVKRFRTINSKIYQIISKQPCAFTGTTNQIEVDHKNGRYDNELIANTKTQKVEDFQPLCKTINDIKRQNCKRCRETNLRYDATKLGYSIGWILGDEKWQGTCKGCIWYDCKEFRKIISEKAIKEE